MSFKENDIRDKVRDSYKNIIEDSSNNGYCGEISFADSSKIITESIGYSKDDINIAPENSNLGLGCGNPQSFAGIKLNETVLDLGSGAGFDCFLASEKVGKEGLVIGVDMTNEMISKSRRNAFKNNYSNVEFRLGEIENLPVGDKVVDVIISNCVINLSPNKQRVYDEAYRVLKEEGRIAISDIVLVKDLTDEMKEDEDLYCAWVTGASSVEELEIYLKNAGFRNINIEVQSVSKEYEEQWGQNLNVGEYIMSASIKAYK